VDGSDDLYLTSSSYDPWNGPEGEDPLNAYSGEPGVGEVLVLKLGSTGAYEWHAFYGSVDGWDYSNAVVVADSGEVYLTGRSEFSWTGPAGEIPIDAHSGGEGAAFQLALDADGAYLWHSFCGEGNGSAIAIEEDGDLYITGGSGYWQGPGGESPLNGYFNEDIFVLKLSSNGVYEWHTFYGGGAMDWGNSIAVSGSGEIYTAGTSAGSWVGPDLEPALSEYSGEADAVVLKLAP